VEYGKYIIKEIRGREVAIMFNPQISHDAIGTCHGDRGETISAGFFGASAAPTDEDPRAINVGVWGKSVTLDMKSRPEDEALIKKVLRPEDF